MSWEGKPQATDDQCREYGYQCAANGDDIGVRRAHLALSVPVSPVWSCVWKDRDEARAVIYWDIHRANSPFAHLAQSSERGGVTFAAVIRSANDGRRILDTSAGWSTERDADVLGRRDLENRGWKGVPLAVICIEERRS